MDLLKQLLAGTAWCVTSALMMPVQAADSSDEAGKMLFTKAAVPACAICHTLEAAGAAGAIGPSLDELQPDAERVRKALKNGIGVMPAFPLLTEEQIQILTTYVAKASRGQ
jgi:mono/diheme cytochrome c family protein